MSTSGYQSILFKACKKIVSSPDRVPIRDLLASLHKTNRPSSDEDRTSFGYYAGKQNAQLRGHIGLDRERDKMLELDPPLRLPDLTDAERDLIWSNHNLLALVAGRVISKIRDQVEIPVLQELPWVAG